MPKAVYRPENGIRTTFAAAQPYGFPIERIVFEVVESMNESAGRHSRRSRSFAAPTSR